MKPSVRPPARRLLPALLLLAGLCLVGCGTKPHYAPSEVERFVHDAGIDSSWLLVKQIYQPDTLYRLVNGEATTYREYGVVKMTRLRYADPLDRRRYLELRFYDMGWPLLACGLFTLQRGPETVPLELGGGGFAADRRIVFWRGAWLVEAAWAGEQPDPRQVLAHIAGKLPGSSEPPAILGRLPQTRRVARTARYHPRGVLGHEFLVNAVEARYRFPGAAGDEAAGRLVICVLPDHGPAKQALEKLREEYRAGGHLRPEPFSVDGNPGFAAADPYEDRAFACRSGRVLVIALGLEEEAARRLIVETLLRGRDAPPG